MTHDPTCDLSSGAAGFCSCVSDLAAPCPVCLKTHEMPKCAETDIVKRLRSRVDRRADPDGIAEDAADEIEMLRRDLVGTRQEYARTLDAVHEYRCRAERSEARVEDLEAALRHSTGLSAGPDIAIDFARARIRAEMMERIVMEYRRAIESGWATPEHKARLVAATDALDAILKVTG